MFKIKGDVIVKNLHKLLFAMLIVIGLAAGCNNEPEEEQTDEAIEETEDNSHFPVTVEDSEGNEITLEEAPENIVSLMPSNTEIAFALGLGDQIVGVSDHDNYPEEVEEKEKVGDLELNIERILSLEPDLVLAQPGNDMDGIEQLQDSGLDVFVVNDATSIEETYESIEMISEVTGTVEEGEELIEDMEEGFAELREKAEEISEDEQKTVYIEISPEPEIYSPGQYTFEDEMLSLIHAENSMSDEEGWVQLNEEAVIEMNPDLIILTYDHVEDPIEEVMSRDGWQDIDAVNDEQVFQVDTDIVSRPGPRLVEGAEAFAKEIYPDVFSES